MIKTEGLTKKYGNFTALDQLNLQIDRGVVYGFVGPNGAGKSTTMSILATLLAPTSGRAMVSGYDVTTHPKQVRRHIGYMPDFFGVYDQFKVSEYLYFFGASYGISRIEMNQMIPQLLELVNLSQKSDAYVDTLSRGMKQRLCLARCLVHDPDVLILDEPASGLDPRARIEMRKILKELRSMGKTILISSHILPELSELCDQIGVIEDGRLVASGKVSEIEKLKGSRLLQIRILQHLEATVRFFENQPLVSSVTVDDQDSCKILISYEGTDEQQASMLSLAIAQNLPIVSFSEVRTNLEDIFLEITKEDSSS
ncbi:ABC transporter ATP-binding protein [Microaerobacter geothermalis]|uniref:ABC transporter ATP-binding protein n=1 Tax=Microaerobacter geothermalis TaxID=674972 RepID=UPI001F430FD4|nr:ABC transporter ATP-binding protein [Microaerobacter geothermalis]MCF6093099.1 ABC transporter ATP-binding protein [Microaerobacter geothermalis]